ncbi:MAG: efflux RND transporter periplasmic adaptor subunit [Endozoicomonas sp.]
MKFYALLAVLSLLLCRLSSAAEIYSADDANIGIQVAEGTVSARALLEPRREAVISSELSASIEKVTVADGQRFKAGEPLVRFICTPYEAGLEEARASLESAEILYKSKKRLNGLNSAGDVEVDLAAADVRRLKAKVKSSRFLVDRCTINAPFNGRVVEVFSNDFENIETGTQLLSVLDDSQLEVSLVIPSNWLVWLKEGHTFNLKVDETGTSYQGVVTQLGSRVDPVSQSIKITGNLLQVPEQILSGMSGTAQFYLPKTR